MEIRITFDPATGQVQCLSDPDMGPGTILKVLEVAAQAHKDSMFARERQPILLAAPGSRLPPVPNGPKK